ncbi:hypothetical protein C1Y63_06100 [Corynebacterium sp. 13CS0277]|uniref:hypothetical protein n=1 Tax=Corynebacterium sp. 13CS0277 TaxID=2071994 RepID=UPI000D037EE1|nr:hypothetical protein [Corynebacterium sp. 13CS0277]PRQ11420.1 hypothetical protein C1Y63_06100 [Corynebacterium sp. 13CS0277]
MSNTWFPLIMFAACAILCATAIPATRTRTPRHPLVVHPSRAATSWFAAATVAYAVATALLFTAVPAAVIYGLGIVGLVTAATGAAAAGYTVGQRR